eukprot:7558235-Pyramimonas_sp.AAC.1
MVDLRCVSADTGSARSPNDSWPHMAPPKASVAQVAFRCPMPIQRAPHTVRGPIRRWHGRFSRHRMRAAAQTTSARH